MLWIVDSSRRQGDFIFVIVNKHFKSKKKTARREIEREVRNQYTSENAKSSLFIVYKQLCPAFSQTLQWNI